MPSLTFQRLSPEKQERINSALIAEFSRAPLSETQVSNIVENAKIARGAFYTYFDSLQEAYKYTLNTALLSLHHGIPTQPPHTTKDLENYIQRTKNFLNEVQLSSYCELFTQHFRSNEESYQPSKPNPELDTYTWQISVLVHQTIRDCLLDPENREHYLTRLQQAATSCLAESK